MTAASGELRSESTGLSSYFAKKLLVQVGALVSLAIASYAAVTGFDVVALRHINRPLPYARAGLAGFLASSFGNNLGFAVVTGGAIRYRIYSQAGLSAVEIAGVSAMCTLTATLGIGFILTLSMLFGAGEVTESCWVASC